MGVLSWIIVGLIAGWLATQVMRGGYGLVGDIILGIIGGLVGGYIAGTLFGVTDAVNGINVTSILVAAVGAIILIAVSRMFLRPRRA
ncbi:MAG: GlsB/YeaQ/YmgE family stress response membrane protein [Chloroflexi bacterium]|nr:GlsB/YeaQ/YmgE family stress response membrane protein [Chloroflexota bacterium]